MRELPGNANARLFEGAEFNSSVSFFHVTEAPGSGPPLHVHPYEETFIIQSGVARFTTGEEEFDVEGEDIVVVHTGIPHRFVNIGNDQLRMLAIHPSPEVVQEIISGGSR